MPWETVSFAYILWLLLAAGVGGLGVLGARWWSRSRRRRARAWRLSLDQADRPARNRDHPDIPGAGEMAMLRPSPPAHPTPEETAVWQRAFERMKDLLRVLPGAHDALCMVVWYPVDGGETWRARLAFNLSRPNDFTLHARDLDEGVRAGTHAYVAPLPDDLAKRMAPCQSGFWMPIRYVQGVERLVLVAHPAPDYFQPNRVRLLRAALTMAALEGARLWQQDALRRVPLLWMHWEQRFYRRLARQLHDGPAQTIAALAMEAGYLQLQAKRDPQAALAHLKHLEERAHQAAQEIRHLLFVLRPVVLDEDGLAAALQDLASKTEHLYGQRIVLEVDAEAAARADSDVKTALFYVAVEGLQNAVKHAHAETVWLRLHPDARPGWLVLEIEDDGQGFDVAPLQAEEPSSRHDALGLRTMHERVRCLGGRLEIHSAPGQGTRLVVHAPHRRGASRDDGMAPGARPEAPADPPVSPHEESESE